MVSSYSSRPIKHRIIQDIDYQTPKLSTHKKRSSHSKTSSSYPYTITSNKGPWTEQEEKKLNDEFLNTQKTTNSILSRASQNIVMKGDVKPMSLNPVQMEKGFKIKISEPKVYETITRTIYQPRQPIISNVPSESIQKKNTEAEAFGNFNSLIQDDREVEQKNISTDNPFLTLTHVPSGSFSSSVHTV